MTYEWQQRQVNEQLALCTPQQQAFFHRLYPSGPRREQIANAYDQIERTLLKNAKAEQAAERGEG